MGINLRFLFAFAFASTLSAQAVPAVSHVKIAPDAWKAIDSIAKESYATHKETALCLSSYAVRDSVLELLSFKPAAYDSSDYVTIWSKTGTICPSGQPSLHTHVFVDAPDGILDGPSNTDLRTNKRVGMWGLLVRVFENGWLLMVYP